MTQKDIERLRTCLREADYNYRLGQPQMSDLEFDKLLQELVKLERQHPELEVPLDSPTRRVGVEPHTEGFETVEHSSPMLSLDNTYSIKDLEKFINQTTKKTAGLAAFAIEAKIDGCAVALRYHKGHLVRAITRGDGIAGDDITDNVRTIKDIPLHLRRWISRDIEIRGEIYMKKSTLDRLNQGSKSPMKNPRNAASGSIKLKDSRECAKRELSFIAHTWTLGKQEDLHAQSDFWVWCTHNTIPIPPLSGVFDGDREVVPYLEDLYNEGNTTISELDVETDGVVLKVHDFGQRKAIGEGSTGPMWAKAIKFESWSAESVIEDIVWEISAYGVLTPVAQIKPVDIAGSTVQRAILHNLDWMRKNRIHCGPALIQKCGKIIPGVARMLSTDDIDPKSIVGPAQCPYCGQAVLITHRKYDAGTEMGGATEIACVNAQCIAQRYRQVENGVKALDIDGVGPALVKQLCDQSFNAFIVTDVFDLFSVTKAHLLSLPRMGEKSADKILKAIADKREMPLDKFIVALGIENIGRRMAKMIAEHYLTLEALLEGTEEQFIEVLGPHAGECLWRGMYEDDRTASLLTWFLENEGKNGMTVVDMEPKPVVEPTKYALRGMTICVTGTLENYTRKTIQEAILMNGGTPVDSVTKKTTHLLVGVNPGSKIDKASKLNIPVMSERQFEELVNG